jgi:hypothetical protein
VYAIFRTARETTTNQLKKFQLQEFIFSVRQDERKDGNCILYENSTSLKDENEQTNKDPNKRQR